MTIVALTPAAHASLLRLTLELGLEPDAVVERALSFVESTRALALGFGGLGGGSPGARVPGGGA